MYHSITISGLLTLELHSLNNEGAEGNTMMTRMVDIIDQEGKKHSVNAVSGDMFKHMLVGHLIEDAKENGLPLCKGCQVFDPNRICADMDFIQDKKYHPATQQDEPALDSLILADALRSCVVDDAAGILITSEIGGKKRSIARKSCVEIGWAVGRPEATTTDSYFHAKYVPEGRGKGSGEGSNLGQNIFHRPASSGQYAVVLNVDFFRVGRNDITLAYELDAEARKARCAALARSVLSTFVKPTGAHRNTQNPHIVDFTGVIATSETSIPAPSVSALNKEFTSQVISIKDALNRIGGKVAVQEFTSLGAFANSVATIVETA